LPDGFVGPGSPPRFCGAAAGKNGFGFGFAAAGAEERRLSPPCTTFLLPWEKVRVARMRGDAPVFTGVYPSPRPSPKGEGKRALPEKSRKLILPPRPPAHNALGFRDGRHELSHLCPEASGACPRVGCDIPKLRQGVRPGRGALNDRPHLPDALESGARASGKSPRTGCWRCHVFQIKPVDGIGRHPVPLPPKRQAMSPWRCGCLPVMAGADYPDP
jgi:hypothetical protein